MRAELCIAAAQPPCVARDVRANARLHAQVVRAAGARVVVFPELSLTGYELDAPPVDGWRLGLAVCRDTGIPRHAADTAALGIDVYVAGVVDRPEDAAVQEERARRVVADHGVAVVIASCAAPTGFGYDRTAGRSGIWPADGSAPVRAGAEPGDLAVARIR